MSSFFIVYPHFFVVYLFGKQWGYTEKSYKMQQKIVLKYKNDMRRYYISLFYQKRIRILSVSLWNAAMEIGNSFWYWALRLYSPMIWSHQAINCFSHTHSSTHIALLNKISLINITSSWIDRRPFVLFVGFSQISQMILSQDIRTERYTAFKITQKTSHNCNNFTF